MIRMTTIIGKWYVGGESTSADCLETEPECDFEIGYGTIRDITRQAEDHVLQTGHTVLVEQARFRTIQSREPHDA
jgi:hypothetical protein